MFVDDSSDLKHPMSSHVSRLPGQWQGHNSDGIDEEPIKPTSNSWKLVPMVSFTLRNPTHLWNQAARASALYLQVRAIFWNKNWRYEREVGENERATWLSDCKPFYLFCPCRPLSSLELGFNGFAGPAWQIFLAWKLDSVLVLFSKNLSSKIQTKTNNLSVPIISDTMQWPNSVPSEWSSKRQQFEAATPTSSIPPPPTGR